MKIKVILSIAIIAVLIGAGIMSYPFISAYVNSKSASEVIDDYVNTVEQIPDTEKDDILKGAIAYNEKLLHSTVVMTDPFDAEAAKITSEEYNNSLKTDEIGLMAVIDIPKIGVHLPIYHGTSDSVLEKAVGHLQGTSLPVGGTGTHCVISAHTGLSTAKLFTDLTELTEGDTFTITTLGEVLTYQVYGIEIVLPSELDSLRINKERDLVTMITCTPYGVNTHRLLVHAERIPTPETVTAEELVKESKADMPVELIAMIAGVLAILLLLIILIIKYGRDDAKEAKKARHTRAGGRR